MLASLALLTPLTAGALLAAPPDPPASRCAAPEARRFDFWIGDWDLVSTSRNRNDPADPVWYETGTARLKVYPVADGCALVAHLEGSLSSGPVHVVSLRAYDPETGRWTVALNWPWGDDPAPVFAMLDGGFVGESGERADFPFRADGAAEGPPDHRYSDQRTGADTYRWESAVSTDGGATWTPQWRMDGTRRDPARGHPLFLGPRIADGRGPACTGQEHRAFDPLLGAWRGTGGGIGGGGERPVTLESLPILDGCAVLEFVEVGGGEPWRQVRVRAFDRGLGRWVQVGVDNGGGGFETVVGGPEAGEFLLATPDEPGRLRIRETFALRPDGKLRWERETSTDRGRVWKTVAEGELRRE